MKIKRYFAKDMRTALTQVKEELGPDAVIMSNKKTATGVEIVAAIDADAQLPNEAAQVTSPQSQTSPSQTNMGASQTNSVASTSGANSQHNFDGPNAEGAAKIASSLDELLKRQRGEQANAPAQPMTNALDSMLERRTSPTPQAASQPIQTAQPSSSVYNPTELTNQQKSLRATEALSQQAESEFEQWLNKARHTVQDDTVEQPAMQAPQQMAPSASTNNAATATNNVVEANFADSNPVDVNVDRQLSDLKTEMNSIKELLKHQVSELMWQDVNRKAPVKAMLINKLRDMGLSSNVSEHLSHFVDDNVESNKAWPEMLGSLTEQLSTTDNEIIKRGGVYSLVGPTGVGKTTTIAKLAARFAQIHGADKVGLITTDSFRIGALEQLATYAKILGCPLKQAKDTEQLSEAIYQLRDKKLLLIDTAGMSQRDIKLTERLNQLLTRSRVNIKNYLVLSATSQMSVLQESVKHFKTIPLSGCIFTKIDESLSLGELISVAIHNRLPIGYLTNGQRVPEDIRVANADKIVQKANQLYELKEKVSNKNNKVVPKAVAMYD